MPVNTLAPQPVAGKGSELVSNGVRISVRPAFLPDQSDPESNRYVFSYRIRIVNETAPAQRIRLVSRAWLIIDADGERKEVQGEGVVGQQPYLEAGEIFEYSSFCPLETNWGTMEGHYTFETPTGDKFTANIGRFYLIGPSASAPETVAGSAPRGRSTRKQG